MPPALGWGQQYIQGSYGVNFDTVPVWYDITLEKGPPPPYPPRETDPQFWTTAGVKNSNIVPLALDSAFFWAGLRDAAVEGPPEYEIVGQWPTHSPVWLSWAGTSFCINRHDGGVNALFLDLSVRKVGLKEFWTLRWHKQFDTRGPWTKAGGVKPEDWPEWMRRFKDY